MTCKDCLHCEVCSVREMLYMNASKTHWLNCDDCSRFKDKTQWAQISQRWIPAAERLPLVDMGNVLCITKGGHFKILSWMETFGCWTDPYGFDFTNFRKEYVTHWMPLPTPPKDGDT